MVTVELVKNIGLCTRSFLCACVHVSVCACVCVATAKCQAWLLGFYVVIRKGNFCLRVSRHDASLQIIESMSIIYQSPELKKQINAPTLCNKKAHGGRGSPAELSNQALQPHQNTESDAPLFPLWDGRFWHRRFHFAIEAVKRGTVWGVDVTTALK